jgi:hypothetical protein
VRPPARAAQWCVGRRRQHRELCRLRHDDDVLRDRKPRPSADQANFRCHDGTRADHRSEPVPLLVTIGLSISGPQPPTQLHTPLRDRPAVRADEHSRTLAGSRSLSVAAGVARHVDGITPGGRMMGPSQLSFRLGASRFPCRFWPAPARWRSGEETSADTRQVVQHVARRRACVSNRQTEAHRYLRGEIEALNSPQPYAGRNWPLTPPSSAVLSVEPSSNSRRIGFIPSPGHDGRRKVNAPPVPAGQLVKRHPEMKAKHEDKATGR